MFRINSINSVNNYQINHKPVFKGSDVQTNPQVEQLSNVQPDYAVKTPMAYTKTGEMNFPYDTKAYCYKLANGQKVIIVPQEGETVLRTYVNTGSMNEPDKLRGISHYIEHNLFNGSQGLEQGDFFKQVDKMGASTNASTGFVITNCHTPAPPEKPEDPDTPGRPDDPDTSHTPETPVYPGEQVQPPVPAQPIVQPSQETGPVQTGDSADPTLWIVLLTISGTALLSCVVLNRDKRRRERRKEGK